MNRVSMAEGVEFLEASRHESWQRINGLLISGEETIMIDGRFGDEKTLVFIRENKVSRYFISHFHIDHSAGAWRIASETNCRPVLNKTEYQYLQSSENMAWATGYSLAEVHELVEEVLMPRIGLRYISDIGAYTLEEIEVITKGRLLAMPAPGHSPGHFCLYAPQTESLYTCDLGLDRFGPWYGFPHCSLHDYLKSINMAYAVGAKRLFSSHGPIILENTEKAIERCRNIIENRHEQVLNAWDKGKRTIKEIAGEGIFYQNTEIFGKCLVPVMEYWQEAMVKCHLEYAGLNDK